MPKTLRDYSKAIIYKIEHIDSPELLYVGSTTDFIKRKYYHKSSCNNNNDRAHNYKLYQMIRENGGWESFKIMIIKEFPCKNKTDLLIEEEKYRKELQANLNTHSAYNTVEEKRLNKYKINSKYLKKYYIINKEKINEKQKEQMACECGSIFRKCAKSRHEKSVKHCEFIKQIV